MRLGDEEELGEGSVQRQQHGDAGGILAEAVFHRHEELPQRPQERQLTGSAAQTQRQSEEVKHTTHSPAAAATSGAFQYNCNADIETHIDNVV